MSVAVKQDHTYLGDDRWEWRVWLTGSDEELDGIEEVEYRLHPTFLRPVQLVKDRETAFRLKASGWGTFELGIRIGYKGGQASFLTHQLTLAYPEEPATRDAADKSEPPRPSPPAPGGEPRRSVFLSASSADSDVVEELSGELETRGMTVMSAEDEFAAGSSWDFLANTAIQDADAVVAIVSDVPVRGLSRKSQWPRVSTHP